MADFKGTKHRDVFDGSDGDDVAFGGGGNDRLSGGDGRDMLAGEDGADRIDGGNGDDTLYAGAIDPDFQGFLARGVSYDTGAEEDKLTGGAGDDYIFAGVGDIVDGGERGSYGNRLYISFMGATEGVSADFRELSDHAVLRIAGGAIRNIDTVGYLEGSDFDDFLAPIDTAYPSGPNVYGRGGNDHLIADYFSGWGGSGLWGGDGDDEIDATGAQYGPKVYGQAGNDVLRVASGLGDLADGGDGDDTIYAGGETHGGGGDDLITMQFTYYAGPVTGNDGDDVISSSTSGNAIDGDAGDDTLIGNSAVDHLRGGFGKDHIDGGGGDDVLTGGRGRDTLTGGAGADTFVFGAGELSAAFNRVDRIRDFSHSDQDTINLAGVDADRGTDEIDHFRFVGDAAFSGTAGELRYVFTSGSTVVEGDTDGDRIGDVFLRLDGAVTLTAEDFELRDAAPTGLPPVPAHPFDAHATGVVLA